MVISRPMATIPGRAEPTRCLCDLFETDCVVFFVPTGTAADALALAALCQPFHSVLCHADAHVQTDECGAPEYAAHHGIKLIPLEGRGEARTGDDWPRLPNGTTFTAINRAF